MPCNWYTQKSEIFIILCKEQVFREKTRKRRTRVRRRHAGLYNISVHRLKCLGVLAFEAFRIKRIHVEQRIRRIPELPLPLQPYLPDSTTHHFPGSFVKRKYEYTLSLISRYLSLLIALIPSLPIS